MNQMRSFEEIQEDIKELNKKEVMFLEQELDKLMGNVDRAKVEKYKTLLFKLALLKRNSKLKAIKAFQAELKDSYFPDGTETLTDMVYNQSLNLSETMFEVEKNYEVLVNFYKQMKLEEEQNK